MPSEFKDVPLRRPPAYGVYRRWPVDGEDWIHPFDVGIVKQMVPSDRVFRRTDLNSEYLLVTYGNISFRVRSAIWHEVKYEGFDVGDYVEVKSQMGKAESFVGRIRDLKWNHRFKYIEYYLHRADQTQVRPYRACDLSLTTALTKYEPKLGEFFDLPELSPQDLQSD